MNGMDTVQNSGVEDVGTLEKKRIRVVLADDHPIVRDGLRKLLTLEDDIDVVGEAADGREVLQVVQEKQPDVVILDLRMPGSLF
jgi:DNA-binding NarL/FixJ family response regulator